MLRTGILNPQLNSLLARVRHTNRLIIADRGFPFWPEIETIDLALIDGIPTVLQVLQAILPNFTIGPVWMAEEFLRASPHAAQPFAQAVGQPVTYEPHLDLKRRVPGSIGLIRTGDTTQYANIILESA